MESSIDDPDKNPSEAKHWGESIKELREQKGLSQAAVARHLGVSRQAVSMWEAGTNYPSPRRKNALYDLLGAKEAARIVAENAMKPDIRDRYESGSDVPLHRTRPSKHLVGGFNFEIPLVGFMKAPDSLPANKDVICFLMPDMSMVPWRARGEPVFVDQTTSPRIGDHALIRLDQPKKTTSAGQDAAHEPFAFMVRLVTGLGPETVRFQAYLTTAETVVPLADVGRMYRVLEWAELYGPLAKVWQSSTFD